MTCPLVTVCIPTYNGSAHLAECLDSVCLQTYGDIEILVVDDCSKDRTVEITRDYQKQDSRIRLVHNERNLGLVGNWERCIDLARGDYIKFAFQDDVLDARCVEALMDAINRGVRFAFCAREFIVEQGTSSELRATLERGRQRISALFAEKCLINCETFCQAVLDTMPTNIVGEPTTTLMHRDVFRRYGRFNPDFLQLLDFEYWCRIGANESISYVPQVLAKFRVHQASATSQNLQSLLYEAKIVDPLMLVHEFAFSPTFRGFRENARKLRPSKDVADLFYEQVHWAIGSAHAKASRHDDPDSTELDALEATATRYPALRAALLGQVPLKYIFARKWRSFKKRLRAAQPSRTVEDRQ